LNIVEIIDFLETTTLSITFSPKGLKYLSSKGNQGTKLVDLKSFRQREDWIADLVISETAKFLETGKHSMPLDFSDFTEFQQKVFNNVSKISPGYLTTYKGIAELLGKPGAAQAVGNAIAKNPVAYFLPTHRVLPQKGIGICKRGAGHLREKLLLLEGHDLTQLRGNYTCTRKKCCME
jgi:O-6-methylguanine DNA methyltransferase